MESVAHGRNYSSNFGRSVDDRKKPGRGVIYASLGPDGIAHRKKVYNMPANSRPVALYYRDRTGKWYFHTVVDYNTAPAWINNYTIVECDLN